MNRFLEGVRWVLMQFRRTRVDRDVADEMRLHVDLRTEAHVDAGLGLHAARRAARRQFGNPVLVAEQSRDVWRWTWVADVAQDLRYGVRAMRRSPALIVVAILSLALGIGANTAIFSVMDALMLRALPVRAPAELRLFGDGRAGGSTDDFPTGNPRLFSYTTYRAIQRQTNAFSGLAAVVSLTFQSHGAIAGGEVESIGTELVSGTYFSVLGITPAAGRMFTDADDQTPGGHPVAVASDSFWNRRFARRADAVGTTVTIGSTIYTIVGVAPQGFFGTTVGNSPDLWIPITMQAQLSPGWNGLDDRMFQSLYLIGRLGPGVSAAQASTDTDQIFRRIIRDYAGSSPAPERVAAIERTQIQLTSAERGLSRLRRRFSAPLQILLGVVGLVLLIACVNIANLLLARSAARSREIAVRQAMGAKRSRLIRQLLTESVLLAGCGGVAGLAFASWANRALLRLVSGGSDPIPIAIGLDGRVLLFAVGVSLGTALLFGTAPALKATKPRVVDGLKDGRNPSGSDARSALAQALVIAQVGVSLVLLTGAGLFLRSLVNLTQVETGFNRDRVLRLSLDVAPAGYEPDARVADLYARIEERVTALPGVEAASVSLFTFNEGSWTDDVTVLGASQTIANRTVSHNVVGNGYFKTMGIPLVAGRTFGPQDLATSEPVAVVNETMAQRMFPAGGAIGQRFHVDGRPASEQRLVVGVVKDAKLQTLTEEPASADYLPYTQHVQFLGDFEVRVAGDPEAMAGAVRRAIADVDRHVQLSGFTTLAAQVDRSVVSQRVVAQLSTFFGLLALLLTSIGLYGLMSYAVTRRTNEIGIRVALGARRAGVVWLVMRGNLRLVGLGVLVGVPVALAGNRIVSSLLFGLGTADAATLAGASVVLLVVSAVAAYIPARKALKVDPMAALRRE